MPRLEWSTREEVETAADVATLRSLELVPELSYGDAAENILVHGDNLAALLSLLPSYAGTVKCIFIDPPYNTKSAFEHYDDNLEHAEWLAMMRPRLGLLQEL